MEHKHNVYDSDTRFSINAITRQIRNESSRKTALMQNDHNSERFTFELPRFIEGHDMSLCNEVEVHYLNISSDKRDQVKGLYPVTDLQISPDDTEKVICSWLISNNATQLVGVLTFRLRFKCVENGVITYAWHTAIFTGISVSDGINADETFEMDYVDIIAQWKAAVTREITDDVNAGVSAWAETESGKVRGEMTAFSAQWNEALNVERKRIDNIVALPDGSTTGDAELMDVRVGADGVTHDSAGTAVRNQTKRIENILTSLGVYEVEKYTLPDGNGNAFANMNGVIGADGKFAETGSWLSTDFIHIEKSTTVINCRLVGVTTVSSVAYYDEAKKFISNVTVKEDYHAVEGVVDIPDSAKYVRFCFIYSSPNQFARVATVNVNAVDDNLHGKIITATGDSITASSASNPQWNYVHQIAEKHRMTYENKAVWGSVIPKNIVVDGKALPSILETIDTMRDDADYIILSGGINDFCYIQSGEEPLGEVTMGMGEKFDESTYCGAFESMLRKAVLKWGGEKIVFVIEHKMIHPNSVVGIPIEADYLPKTKKMLEKWGIPYVDLYNEVAPLGLIPELRDIYTWDADGDGVGDGWHPNKEGYQKFYVPLIEAKLKTI